MAITFTAAERLAITRRQLRIDLENEGFQKSSDSFNTQQAALLQVDVSNSKFYDYYNTICQGYENEARQMNGGIPDTYSAGDVTAAGQNPAQEPFYPINPDPAYIRNIPLIADAAFTNNKVKGYFHTTGADSRYEQNILTNVASPTQGLTQVINWLLNGITASPSASTTTQNPNNTIAAGTVTNVNLDVVSSANFVAGQTIYIRQGSASGIYKVASIPDGAHINVSSILPSAIGFTGPGSSISNTVAGFTNTERNTLTSGSYQEILTSLTTIIPALVLEWESKIDSQITIIPTNNEDRATQVSQLATALADVNNTKSIIDTWQALSNTGASGKYVNTGINPISAEITARQSFITTRLSQITTALGGTSSNALSQSGNTYSTSSAGNPYYNRYKWLNIRINRMTGSLRRYYSSNDAKGAVDQMKNDNLAIKAEYAAYFNTKAVIFNDGSDIIHVKDTTGLSNGNTVTVVSETQPEITRTISQLMGTTQVKLNAPVPETYTIADIARVFKTL